VSKKPGTLHLAAVFGLHPNSAIRYVHAARQLLEISAERYGDQMPGHACSGAAAERQAIF
jgi:hypothetical protein